MDVWWNNHWNQVKSWKNGPIETTDCPKNEWFQAPGYVWVFPKIVVPPNHSILIGFSIINHPFWGPTPIFGNTNMYINFGTMSIQLMVDSWPGFFVVALGFDHGTPEIIVPFKEDPIIQQKMVASWTSRGQSKQNHFVTKKRVKSHARVDW